MTLTDALAFAGTWIGLLAFALLAAKLLHLVLHGRSREIGRVNPWPIPPPPPPPPLEDRPPPRVEAQCPTCGAVRPEAT